MDDNGINTALAWGHHCMTKAECGKDIRTRIEARPICEFAGMQSGKTYFFKHGYDHRNTACKVLACIKTTPKGKQATLSAYPDHKPYTAYAGSFHGSFYELDAELVGIIGITHREVVQAALSPTRVRESGYFYNPPLKVKIEYPDLFVEIPKRFAKRANTEVERVVDSLSPRFPIKAVDRKLVAQWIEQAHTSIRSLTCERTRKVCENPALSKDYDEYIEDYKEDIDFYRWLEPLVSKGGMFAPEG